MLQIIARFVRFRSQPTSDLFKQIRANRKGRPNVTLLATRVLAVLLVMAACKPSTKEQEPLPVFDGVTTEFALTRSRIKGEQPLEVRVTFRNTEGATREFRFLAFGVDARLYSNGQLLEDLCRSEASNFPVQSLTLNSGETVQVMSEVATHFCYKLAPGAYSIRFNYNLRVLENEALRTKYEKQYGLPARGIVPWDGRDHPFTVVK
jgi:hypothetical protein